MISTDSLVLQLSYALLIVAMLARTTRHMRLMIAVAGVAILVHAVLRADYAALGWMVLLIGVWLIKLWGDRTEGRKIRFTPVEEAMRRTYLATLPRGAARQFIDLGLWLRGAEDDVLTNEGEPVTNLYYLVSGEACATIKGREVGLCRPGDLIGEATIVSGDDATATVTLTEPSTFWCASTPTVTRFLDDHEGLRSAIERSFSNAVKDKLRAANLAIAETNRAA
jgi:CRP-like cAMP-binding protein